MSELNGVYILALQAAPLVSLYSRIKWAEPLWALSLSRVRTQRQKAPASRWAVEDGGREISCDRNGKRNMDQAGPYRKV
jgi:hypothetical protein